MGNRGEEGVEKRACVEEDCAWSTLLMVNITHGQHSDKYMHAGHAYKSRSTQCIHTTPSTHTLPIMYNTHTHTLPIIIHTTHLIPWLVALHPPNHSHSLLSQVLGNTTTVCLLSTLCSCQLWGGGGVEGLWRGVHEVVEGGAWGCGRSGTTHRVSNS